MNILNTPWIVLRLKKKKECQLPLKVEVIPSAVPGFTSV